MLAPFQEVLELGLRHFGLSVDEPSRSRLERFSDRLLAWNQKVNLTAITDPGEVAEKHILDSLVLAPALEAVATLLDLGSGAGLPGVPLACVRGDLEVTCVDSAAKKIAFVRAVSAELDVGVRAVATRVSGDPEGERVPRAQAVVSRALMEPDKWLPLAARYVSGGGLVLTMLGREADEALLRKSGERAGLKFLKLDRYTLPLSQASRAIATFSAPL